MKLVFLGTRGYIGHASRRHRRHTSTLVCYRRRAVMIDCGEDWGERVFALRPHAIVITHAHPDHALGLKHGSPCPVFATPQTWEAMARFDIAEGQRRTLRMRQRWDIEGITFEPFYVVHSTRAPAVGFRVSAGQVAVFYAPDVVEIPEKDEAFAGIKTYIGDGASLRRGILRRERGSGMCVGHAAIRHQLEWCERQRVPRMIVTHCGSEIVTGDARHIDGQLRALSREHGVRLDLAYDGMEVVLR